MRNNDKRLVLLIGTGFAAAPLAYYLKTQGYMVSVCGNIPHDPCVSWADEYHNLDYSNIDALIQLVKEKKFYAICPTVNDVSYLSGSYVAKELGYPGFDKPEATEILLKKIKFREFSQKHNLPVPKTFDPTNLNEMLKERNFPIIIKPVDSYSGRGVNKVTKTEDICAAIVDSAKYSRSQQIVAEQFVEGTLHSHSAFIKKYDIIKDFFVDEFCTVYPYQVDCSNIPSLLNKRIRQRVRECISELTKLLRLNDGLLHTQFIVSNGDIYLIECTRRCPGDLYYYLISFSTSMPYIENYLHPFLGKEINFPSLFSETPYARHTISIAEDSIVYGFSHKIPSKEVKCFPLRVSGALVRRAPFDRIAILLARFSNTTKLFKITPELRKFIHIERELTIDA